MFTCLCVCTVRRANFNKSLREIEFVIKESTICSWDSLHMPAPPLSDHPSRSISFSISHFITVSYGFFSPPLSCFTRMRCELWASLLIRGQPRGPEQSDVPPDQWLKLCPVYVTLPAMINFASGLFLWDYLTLHSLYDLEKCKQIANRD